MRYTIFPLIILLASAIWSCRSVKYVPIEIVKSDTTYINKIQKDSIYQLDSIYIIDRGDTVLITKTKYVYRDKLVRDTVYICRIDSMQVFVPVGQQLTWFQQFRMNIGSGVIVFIITVILITIGWLVYKSFK